jgi:hypothetical protein
MQMGGLGKWADVFSSEIPLRAELAFFEALVAICSP